MIRSMVSKMVRSMITTVINPFDGLISRYFVTLDPVLNSYYEMAQPITFAGDFEVEVEFKLDSLTGEFNLFGSSSSDNWFRIDATNGGFDWKIGASFKSNDGSYVFDNKLHKGIFRRIGSLAEVEIDGSLIISTVINQGAFEVSYISARQNLSSNFFDGIIANAKFTDKSGASDVVTTFKLNNSPAVENYVYGGEEVVNGDFANGLTGWYAGALGQISNLSNSLRITDTGSGYGRAVSEVAFTVGKSYAISFDIVSITTGNAIFGLTNNSNGVNEFQIFSSNSVGTKYFMYTPSQNTNYISLVNLESTPNRVTVYDNITVKEITNYTEANAASEIEYSQESVLGSELVVNGGFSNGTANWLSNGTSILSVVNGVMEIDRNGGQQFKQCYQDITTIIGKNYIFNADIIYKTNSINIYIDGVEAAEQWDGASLFFTATSTTTEIGIYPSYSLDATAKIDNVSIKEITNAVEYKNIPQSARELYSLEDDTWVGSNELVVNGDFATDSGWNKPTNCTISNGKALLNGVTQGQQLWQTFSKAGTYEVTFTVLDYVSGGVAPYFHNATFSGQTTAYSNGTYTQTITTTTPSRFAIRIETAPAILSIDNVSVKEVIEVAS